MKVRKLLELQSTIEERKVPCDMNGELNKHYSESKEKEKRLSDEIVKYLTQNPYEKGGKEVNPSNKDLKIGLNSKCLAIYDML